MPRATSVSNEPRVSVGGRVSHHLLIVPMGLRVVWQLELLEQLSRVRPGGNTPTVNDHNRLLELSVRLALKKKNTR